MISASGNNSRQLYAPPPVSGIPNAAPHPAGSDAAGRAIEDHGRRKPSPQVATRPPVKQSVPSNGSWAAERPSARQRPPAFFRLEGPALRIIARDTRRFSAASDIGGLLCAFEPLTNRTRPEEPIARSLKRTRYLLILPALSGTWRSLNHLFCSSRIFPDLFRSFRI